MFFLKGIISKNYTKKRRSFFQHLKDIYDYIRNFLFSYNKNIVNEKMKGILNSIFHNFRTKIHFMVYKFFFIRIIKYFMFIKTYKMVFLIFLKGNIVALFRNIISFLHFIRKKIIFFFKLDHFIITLEYIDHFHYYIEERRGYFL